MRCGSPASATTFAGSRSSNLQIAPHLTSVENLGCCVAGKRDVQPRRRSPVLMCACLCDKSFETNRKRMGRAASFFPTGPNRRLRHTGRRIQKTAGTGNDQRDRRQNKGFFMQGITQAWRWTRYVAIFLPGVIAIAVTAAIVMMLFLGMGAPYCRHNCLRLPVSGRDMTRRAGPAGRARWPQRPSRRYRHCRCSCSGPSSLPRTLVGNCPRVSRSWDPSRPT